MISKMSCCFFLVLSLFIFLNEQGEVSSAVERKAFSNVFLSDAKLRMLQRAVDEKKDPTFSSFKHVLEYANENIDRQPIVLYEWYVPGFYSDPAGHKKAKNTLRDDANAAYALALCYRITDRAEYAESAIRLIDAWVMDLKLLSPKDDSRLAFSYHFPAIIFAADLLRDENVWPLGHQEVFSRFLKDSALAMSTMEREDNWGSWGLLLTVACAVYLEDSNLFNKCRERWKYFIENQIANDGHLRHEVWRSKGQRGIWYSHFCLMPQTIVAEILKINGSDLFDYTSPSGHTLKTAFCRIAAWTDKPESFPYWKGDHKDLLDIGYFSYFEILNPKWNNDSASRLITQSRPLSANHSAPFLTFTHGQNIDHE